MDLWELKSLHEENLASCVHSKNPCLFVCASLFAFLLLLKVNVEATHGMAIIEKGIVSCCGYV